MTWLQNKEINYSTPSLYPSPYVQECTRTSRAHKHTHKFMQKESVTHPPTQHTPTLIQNKTNKEEGTFWHF